MVSFAVTVDAVMNQAVAVGAQRICFWDGQLTFAEPSATEVAELLPRFSAGKYKFQSRIDGRWTDTSKYVHVLDSRALLTALEQHAFAAAPSISVHEVEAAGRLRPERLHRALRKLLYDTIARQMKRPTPHGLIEVCRYFERFRGAWAGDDHFEYFLAYFSLMRAAFAEGLADAVSDTTHAHVERVARVVAVTADQQPASVGATAAAHCVLGQIRSLADREAAAAHFAELRQGPGADLVTFFYWDSGALTYYGAADLEPTLAADVDAITRSIEPIRVPATANQVGVGVSMDLNFFRIYAGWLYFYAQQLPEIDFNFFLCATAEETEAVLRDGDNFANALAALNRCGTPENVQIYRVPTPDFVAEEKTFYACARFFGAEALLSKYPNVYLMDADLYLKDNPMAFFRSVRDVAMAAPKTITVAALSPWRRFMAGNIPLSRRALDSGIIRDWQCYMAHGLRQRGSWMLDQNALTYAIERDQGRSFVPLNTFKPPFEVSKFMRTWEASYRNATRPPSEG